jgi:hypothetical protein
MNSKVLNKVLPLTDLCLIVASKVMMNKLFQLPKHLTLELLAFMRHDLWERKISYQYEITSEYRLKCMLFKSKSRDRLFRELPYHETSNGIRRPDGPSVVAFNVKLKIPFVTHCSLNDRLRDVLWREDDFAIVTKHTLIDLKQGKFYFGPFPFHYEHRKWNGNVFISDEGHLVSTFSRLMVSKEFYHQYLTQEEIDRALADGVLIERRVFVKQ